MERPMMEKPDVREKGGVKDGVPQVSDRRLFMQLLAFGDCLDRQSLVESLRAAKIPSVLYQDLNDPYGVALLTFSDDPAFFVGPVRDLLHTEPWLGLELKPQYTMFGRTYGLGYEPDLEEALFTRPTKTVLNPQWPWVVWYPLRRSGSFAQLDHKEQRDILMEHGTIGRSFGEADLAHDVRLACQGLDQNDNDFVIGLIGKDLHPLSSIVQAMRKTKQTSQYLDSLGPFWIGKAVWQFSA